ncbi:type IV pilus modification PilV family protein [Massilia sp. BKSP1R2A-1]|uniref:type IV pilus modification PilV family protein n=1 Tax=Massilia sp. BKSP1R2A-1 TaxID=3422595 RepID=UPI003D336EE9
MSSRRFGARGQGGVTLIELIIFIVIVGVAVMAVLGVLSMTTKNSADPLRRKQALMIAEGLLEEVQLAKFTFCQPTADNVDTAANSAACTGGLAENWGAEGTSRPHDNINDYVPAANTPTAAFNLNGQLSDANGNPMPVSGYAASVTITPQALGGIGAGGASANTDVFRIRVTVSYGSEKVVLDGFRARYAPNFP